MASAISTISTAPRAPSRLWQVEARRQTQLHSCRNHSSLARFPAGRAALSETESKDALAAFGVPVVHDALVQTADEARKAAETVGFPLVAKLVSPDVAHKTEHGLIRLGIKDADAARLKPSRR